MYTPPNQILEKYADVLINFALGGGDGIKKGEVVYLQVPESAKLLLAELQKAVLKSGGNFITNFLPEGVDRNLYEFGSEEQINFMPKDYLLELVNTCDHTLRIISAFDKFELKGVDSKKIIGRQKAAKFFMDARTKKENEGKLTWTIGMYGTEEMAKIAGMSSEEYWNQIIKACYLNEGNPVAKWREVSRQMEDFRTKLTNLKINKVHIKGEDADIEILIGKDRKWLGGSGRNIPSFELFTSPDWRGTNGWIKFNQPLYRYGNMIKGIELEFKDGVIVSSKAEENEELLKEMLSAENADKIGEFSLTDRRFSKIDKFMAETLYDENVGGEYGNTHLAVGASFHDAYNGDIKSVDKKGWEDMGFNESAIHTDIMSTANREVTAILEDGTQMLIYKDGEFKI